MKKTLKTKWVKALESGRYEQCEDSLKSAFGGYCCLGVLRKIMHPESKDTWIDRTGDRIELLSKPHQIEAGLTKKIQNRLAAMNDAGKTFTEIAKYIRAKL